MPETERFSYCVGHPWDDIPSSICIYTYHTEIHHGTMKEAEDFRAYVNKKNGKENFIYRLVKIEEN